MGAASGGDTGGILRWAAVGAVAGALAGFLFGVCAVLIQTAITASLIGRYGNSAVDHGAAFLNPGLVIPLGLLGAFVGVSYGAARPLIPWPGPVVGLLFALLLTLMLQPLLAAGLDYFSAVVSITRSGTTPSGFAKTGSIPQDVAPQLMLGFMMAALLFLEGLTIAGFARLGTRWMPRLPRAVYAVVAGGLGLPGLAFFGLLILVAAGGGGE